MRFLVANDTAGQPSWWLYADNNKMVAWAGETFASTSNAHRAAVAFKAGAYLEVTCGEYAARCQCSTTFRNTHEDVLPRAAYDNKVRDLVLDRILKDGMSIERTLGSLRREFLLDL